MEIVLIIILLLLVFYAFGKSGTLKKESLKKDTKIANLNRENSQLKTDVLKLQTDKGVLSKKNAELLQHNDALRKYQDIIDVKLECEYLLQKAQRDSLKIKARAELELSDAQGQAREMRRNVKELTEKRSREIELLYENAVNEAKRIVDNAEIRAESIGGDAYRSLREADQIAERVKAMKNVIKGYGNEYLIPTYTLLDELAEDFGHKEAGENLKKLRQNNKLMIVSRQAGICDYMDESRRNTAIDFVIDAYNGKVDSILSSVKKDNFGTLKQKMDDAFQLVNFNGQAFRNARISEVYHSARVEELKWAVVAQELKWQEQEEQKLQFQQKLEELQQKLTQAEEKNQRAISMAQQTRTGNVYIISNIGSFGEDVYKIGMTRRLEPLDRVRELGDASVPFEFDVHAMIYCDDAPALEKQLHRKFLKRQLNKINPRKEFFKLNIHEVRSYLESMGINCKWTLSAEAKQYRETLKLEEEMKTNKQLEAEWEQYQEVEDPVTYDEVMSEE